MSRACLLALSMGGALRLGAVWAWRGQPILAGGDDSQYLAMASSLAAGEGLRYRGGPTAYRMPLYPLFLAAGKKAAPEGSTLDVLRLLQALWSLLAVWLAYRLGRELGGEGAGAASAWLLALHPEQVLLPTSLYSECFYSPFVLAAAWALARWRKAPGPRRAAVLAAAIGGSLLVRSTLAPFAALCALWRLAETRSRKGLREAGMVLGFAALPLLPWVLRNAAVFGRFIPFETGLAGPVLLHAAEGHVRAPPSQEREPALARIYSTLPHTEWDGYAGRLALGLIRERPGRYLSGCLRRAAYLWTDSYAAYLLWYHRDLAPRLEEGRRWDLVRWGERLLRLALVLLGAAALAAAARAGRAGPWALAGLLGYFTLYALGAVFIRFMAPATALLCALAGAGSARLARSTRASAA